MPGGVARRSSVHFVRHFSPLRKSFIASRRQIRQTGPAYRAISAPSPSPSEARRTKRTATPDRASPVRRRSEAAARKRSFRADSSLHPPPLRRATAVVRDRRDVGDREDLEAGGLERADRRLTAGAGTLHVHLDLLHPEIERLARRVLRGHLRGIRRRLARAFPARCAGARPRDDGPGRVGDRDDGVVERGLDVRGAARDGPALAPAPDALLRLRAVRALRGRRRRRGFPARGLGLILLGVPVRHFFRYSPLRLRRCLLLARDGLARTLARARVRPRALSPNGEAAPVPRAAVRADLLEPLDVQGHLAPQLALDVVAAVDDLADARDLRLGEIADADAARHVRVVEHLPRARRPDAVDVAERDLDALLARYVDAGDACHPFPPS